MNAEVSPSALRAFKAVAEELHFGRAAEQLFLSVSALSQQITRLERQLGASLFARTSRSVALTREGEELLPLAVSALASLARVERWARDLPNRGASIRMGFVYAAPGPTIDRIFADFREFVGDVTIAVCHLTQDAIVRALLSGKVDLITIWGPVFDNQVESVQIYSAPRAAVLRSDHPLAGGSTISLADIAHERTMVPRGLSEREQAWWIVDPRPDGTHPIRGTTFSDEAEAHALVALAGEVHVTADWIAQSHNYPNTSTVRIDDADPVPLLIAARTDDPNPLVGHLLNVARRLAVGDR